MNAWCAYPQIYDCVHTFSAWVCRYVCMCVCAYSHSHACARENVFDFFSVVEVVVRVYWWTTKIFFFWHKHTYVHKQTYFWMHIWWAFVNIVVFVVSICVVSFCLMLNYGPCVWIYCVIWKYSSNRSVAIVSIWNGIFFRMVINLGQDNKNNNISNNNNNTERISRAPFHMKHAQLRWTGANTKIHNTCI